MYVIATFNPSPCQIPNIAAAQISQILYRIQRVESLIDWHSDLCHTIVNDQKEK